MKRVFTAIDVTEFERRSIFRLTEHLRSEFPNARVKWEHTEKIHLTLKFLGDIDDTQLAKLIEAVEETSKKIQPFYLQMSGTGGVFPSPRNARVLWLGLADETGSLQKLNEILEGECQKRGFAVEKREFKAHLTIARFRQKPDEFLIERFLQTIYPPSPPFEVSEIVIYESELQPRGSVYKIISKHKLR
jgi:2'-5' RNA ligase